MYGAGYWDFAYILIDWIFMTRYYAGIGSRETPSHILDMMASIAIALETKGFVLRSGGADGADSAFARDVTNTQVFIPWTGFNGVTSSFIGASDRAMGIAKNIHPAWDKCSQGAQKLHGRNVHQVLGVDIDPATYSRFVICWTPRGLDVGGTATAIRLARSVGIPVFNLAIDADYDRLKALISA